jgi:hypothetical protein
MESCCAIGLSQGTPINIRLRFAIDFRSSTEPQASALASCPILDQRKVADDCCWLLIENIFLVMWNAVEKNAVLESFTLRRLWSL